MVDGWNDGDEGKGGVGHASERVCGCIEGLDHVTSATWLCKTSGKDRQGGVNKGALGRGGRQGWRWTNRSPERLCGAAPWAGQVLARIPTL